MPLPPDYTGGQSDDQMESLNGLRIEPSILEGRFLIPSTYGKDAAIPLHRYGPSNKAKPTIVGDRVIPALLTVEEGQWDASPSAQFEYQWMADGIDIPGAISKTWMSDILYDGQNITAEVKAFNRWGQAYELTPELNITRIEPVEVHDGDYHILTGLGSEGWLTQFGDRTVVITGTGAENAQTVVRSTSYYISGRSADDRKDINSTYYYVLTGLQIEDQVLHQNTDISVVNYDWGVPLVDGVSQRIKLKNPGAEMGLLAWDVVGIIVHENQHGVYEGGWVFYGGDDADTQNVPYSYMSQSVELDPEWLVDVDAGTTFVELNWMQRSHERADQGNIYMEFYGASDNFLGKTVGPGLWGASTAWILREHDDTAIPVGTRKIRYVVEFNLVNADNNNGYVDYIQTFIRKGAKITSRDFGPNFRMWRTRFTQARTYSGGALQELEFRHTEGGAEQPSGGVALYGSSALGGNVSYIYDGIRGNGGYWAGEEAGINNGTAWVGYDFGLGNEFKPEEINLTPRDSGYHEQLPVQLMLEGSDDGATWHKVQEFSTPDPVNSAQIPLSVARGTVDYQRNAYGAYSIDSTSGRYSRRNYGEQLRAKTRLTIDGLSTCNRYVGDQFKLYLVRMDFAFSAGRITEILYESPILDQLVENAWTDVAIPPTVFEVGEHFGIINHTVNFATTSSRSFNQNIFGASPLVDKLGGFRSDHSDGLEVGDGGDSLFDWFAAVDFKGSIF